MTTPHYDFACDECGQVREVTRRMADAGQLATCPTCAQPMRRLYDTSGPVIMRPVGFSRRGGDPDYWHGFNDPLPPPTTWRRGRHNQRVKPGPEYVGVEGVDHLVEHPE
ncbi:MAG: zinc ribbon domain-containing protein [Chloroflexi bacterium]|nr:zinc ribbon domain-containing protein [Chloroflexota bacterium]